MQLILPIKQLIFLNYRVQHLTVLFHVYLPPPIKLEPSPQRVTSLFLVPEMVTEYSMCRLYWLPLERLLYKEKMELIMVLFIPMELLFLPIISKLQVLNLQR